MMAATQPDDRPRAVPAKNSGTQIESRLDAGAIENQGSSAPTDDATDLGDGCVDVASIDRLVRPECLRLRKLYGIDIRSDDAHGSHCAK
jgi:hypothetical protein